MRLVAVLPASGCDEGPGGRGQILAIDVEGMRRFSQQGLETIRQFDSAPRHPLTACPSQIREPLPGPRQRDPNVAVCGVLSPIGGASETRPHEARCTVSQPPTAILGLPDLQCVRRPLHFLSRQEPRGVAVRAAWWPTNARTRAVRSSSFFLTSRSRATRGAAGQSL